jgi:hypothetical protein
MEPQSPAVGILKRNDWGDSKWYVIPCTCGCENDVKLTIEVDDGHITSHFYSQTKTNYWYNLMDVTYKENWFVLNAKILINDWYNRFSVARKALFNGYVETESYVLMDEQQAINFAHTIINATDDLHKFRDETTKSGK